MKKILTMLCLAVLVFASPALAFDTELIGGAGLWTNDLAEGNYFYGEGMLWLDGEYSPGVGIYAMTESGESKLSAYTWDGHLVGPQVGFKRYWLDGSNLANQWQLKLRYVWEKTDGENSDSGYKMTQKNTKLGLYGEYVGQLDKRWQGILILEGWKTLTKEKDSTWDGDQAENRDQYSAGLFGQYKFSDPLSVRAGASLFHQGWDDLSGARFQAEARVHEHLMVGPYVSVPFGVPNQYEGSSESDLVTWGVFGRVEF